MTIQYDDARNAAEAATLARFDSNHGDQQTFTREEVLRWIHSASLRGFNDGATWAQATPELAGQSTVVGKLFALYKVAKQAIR